MTSVFSNTLRRHTQWTPREIQHFFSRAQRVYQGPHFDVRIAPQSHSQGQLLIVTPKKMGNAPQRNLFKRRVKAIFHEHQLHFCGFDIGVFGKPGASAVSFAELSAILISVCKRCS